MKTAYAIYVHCDYGGEQGLLNAVAAKKCFGNFNTEQKADIVEDYYKRTAVGQATYPWRVFIDQVRAQGACIWPATPAPSRTTPEGTSTG